MRDRLAVARVAHLATARSDGRPHVVPCCFALHADSIVSAVDAKPKTTTELRRLDNVRANPSVSLLVDHYDDDWSRLWWVRVDGTAVVLAAGHERDAALAALAAKYPQYVRDPPPGPVIAIEPTAWHAWP